jgi:hydrogenase maturation factor
MNVAQRDAYEERAAILEFDAGLSREDAERQARELVMRLCGHCLGGHHGPGRCSDFGCACCGMYK